MPGSLRQSPESLDSMLDMSLMKYARVFAFVLLAVVTVYGAYGFFTGDWTSAADFWRSKLPVIPLVALLALVDVALEAIGWMWVYHRFRIQAFDRGGVAAYLVVSCRSASASSDGASDSTRRHGSAGPGKPQRLPQGRSGGLRAGFDLRVRSLGCSIGLQVPPDPGAVRRAECDREESCFWATERRSSSRVPGSSCRWPSGGSGRLWQSFSSR